MCFLLCFHLVQGSGFKVQGSRSGFAAFLLGDARKWHLSHQSLVTPTIRGKESSHMYGVRSFGSVPTCSGWGFSHMGRFRPLRMTIREGGRALIWEIRCMFWKRKGSYLGDTLHVLELAVLYYDTSSPLTMKTSRE